MANRFRGQWVASPPGGWVAGDTASFNGTEYQCATTGTTSQPGTDGTWLNIRSGGGNLAGTTALNALFLPALPADPGVNPVSGGELYVGPTGALKFRSSAGTVTTVAPA